jgi:antitoxin component YwqK of YwqJK toxin-antitoxin module
MATKFHRKTLAICIPSAKEILRLGCVGFLIAMNTYLTAGAQYNNNLPVPVKQRLITEYHANGKIKVGGYQGHYSDQHISTGAYIGTWKYYDNKGKLTQSIYYHNDIPSKAFIQKKTYYINGRLKSVETFNNFELYESEILPMGKWKYYDTKGKLVKEIDHQM